MLSEKTVSHSGLTIRLERIFVGICGA